MIMIMILVIIIIFGATVAAFVYLESLHRARRISDLLNKIDRLFNKTLENINETLEENIKHHDWLLRTGLIETAYSFTKYGSALTIDVKKWTQ